MSDCIALNLVETNFHTRWPCSVCGGATEKVSVLTEGRQDLGDGDYRVVRVCETCLKGDDGLTLDQRLELHARASEGDAAMARSLIGQLKVPTFSEWRERETRVDVATHAAYCIGSAHGDSSPAVQCIYDKVLSDDAVYAEWRRDYDSDKAERERQFSAPARVGIDDSDIPF